MINGATQNIQRSKNSLVSFLVTSTSLIRYAARRFIADGMMLSAGALTFSTLLALVPLMVIAFAILSGFATFDPARDRMEDLFFNIFVPEFGAEVGAYITEFSRNATNLTVLGIIALAVTAVMLLWTIEATLNDIWRVQKPRSMGVRVLIYWTVLTLGPLLLGASFALTSGTFTTLTQWARHGVGLETELALPTLGVFFALATQSLTFTLLFKIVPARLIRLRDAAVGGIIAGVGVQVLRLGFDKLLIQGSTYETVYGAVAILPIFLFWLYLSWGVVIFGAVFAASLPDWWKTRSSMAYENPTSAQQLEVAITVLSIIAHHAQKGETTAREELQSATPSELGNLVFDQLCEAGYIIVTENDRIGLLRDLHLTTVAVLARDLGLTLGSGRNGETVQITSIETSGSPTSRSLHRMLKELHSAETAILDQSLNDVIYATPFTDFENKDWGVR